MRMTRANFGDLVWIRPVAAGMRVSGNVLKGDLLLDRGRIAEFKYTWATEPSPETGPFEIADFGKVYRLSWAAGACAIPLTREPRFCYWGQRFALSLVDQTMILIDATRPTLVHVTAGELFDHRHYSAPRSHAGRIWIEHSDNILEIPHAELEALFDRTSGPIEVAVEETYPREHAETRTAEVVEIAKTAMSVKFEDGKMQPIKIVPGVELHMKIELHRRSRPASFTR